MRKIFALTLSLAAIALSTSFAPATADEGRIITLTEKQHQNFDGTFKDDFLATLLAPDGRLGKLVYSPGLRGRSWVIDSALLDQVASMAQGYELSKEVEATGVDVAQSWLARLKLSSASDPVWVLPYGNPDIRIAKQLAPSELRLYYQYAQMRAELILERPTSADTDGIYSTGKSRMSNLQRQAYSNQRKDLTALSTVVDTPELLAARVKLANLLSPAFSYRERIDYYVNTFLGVEATLNKLRIASGKYQLTSSTSKVPVTVVNDFDVPVTVNVQLTPLNSRVQVEDVQAVNVGANSRAQLSIPFTVIASGSTEVTAVLTNAESQEVGTPALLSLNSTIIDSRVTWFTWGAALILLIAATVQTVKRIRRSRR